MPQLLIAVDGQTRYEGHVPDVVLPSDPAMIPEALRGEPGQPPTPLARLTLLTAMIEILRRGLESPMLQPITVDVATAGMGKATITVVMDLPDAE